MKTRNVILAVGLMMVQVLPALAAEGFSKNFDGKVGVQLNYHGASGRKALVCATTAAFTFGLTCISDSVSLPDTPTGGDWGVEKATQLSVGGKLNVRSAGEGKVLVQLRMSGTKGCASYQVAYKGFETAYQVYNLFPVTEEHPEPTPYDSHAEAQLTLDGSRASVSVLGRMAFETAQKGGHVCQWTISPGDPIEMRGEN